MAIESVPILLFLIVHFLGDFHLQGSEIKEEKQTPFSGLFKHLMIHAGLIIIVLFGIPKYWLSRLLIWVSRLIVDGKKYS